MKTASLLASALSVVLLALGACQTTSQPVDRFAKVDVDNNDELSIDEVNVHLVNEIFTARDKNKDRQLTRDEWVASDDAAEARQFRQADTNNDGMVSFDEAVAAGRRRGQAKQFIREADTNKNGKLTRAEATAYYASREGPVR